jgi:hypothetical protein
VQSIDRYLSAGDGEPRGFHGPLVLTGGKPVATDELLLAIASDVPLPELANIDQPAEAFFATFGSKLQTNAGIDIAVEGFRLR